MHSFFKKKINNNYSLILLLKIIYPFPYPPLPFFPLHLLLLWLPLIITRNCYNHLFVFFLKLEYRN